MLDKKEYQTAINVEFMAIVSQLVKINGWGEKARIAEIIGIKPRTACELYNGRKDVKQFYLEQVRARLRNAKK
jgi:hypothetical protein